MRLFFQKSVSLYFLFFSFSIYGAKTVDQTIATVNDEIILFSDLDRFIEKSKSKSFQELFGGIPIDSLSDKKMILQLLIEEKIINQQVKKLEIGATEQEIDGQINVIIKRNGITKEQLISRLKQLGTSFKEYREGIQRQIERRNLIEREIRPSLEASDENVRHFYQRSFPDKGSEITYKIAHIFFDSKKKSSLSAKERASKIYGELSKDPSLFDSHLKDYSDDVSSIDSGGLLGSFSLSSLASDFKSIVPNTPVNGITPPIKTTSGYHIVKVLEKKTADFDTLSEERKNLVRNQMVTAELEKKMTLWLERKKRESHIRLFLNNL